MYCVGDACIERCWQVDYSGVSVTTLGSKNDYVLALSTQSQQGIFLTRIVLGLRLLCVSPCESVGFNR
jgi:hypothetical protein